jgi:hypothetical protein
MGWAEQALTSIFESDAKYGMEINIKILVVIHWIVSAPWQHLARPPSIAQIELTTKYWPMKSSSLQSQELSCWLKQPKDAFVSFASSSVH